jgi:hypothetical protein
MGCLGSRAAVDEYLQGKEGNFGKASDIEIVMTTIENHHKQTLTKIIQMIYIEKTEYEDLKECQEWMVKAKFSDESEETYAVWLDQTGQTRIDKATLE